MEKVLYNYCTVENFKNIIKNRTLHFSDVMKSNDSEEIISLWKEYQKFIEMKASNKTAVDFLKFNINHQLDEMLYLALCFSQDGDSLHMWNCYGKFGIALGFDREKVEKWTKSICYHIDNYDGITNATYVAKLEDVTYMSSTELTNKIATICGEPEFVTDGFGDVFAHAPFCKSDFFASEKETRIIIELFLSKINEHGLDYVDGEGNFLSSIKIESCSNKEFPNVLACNIPFPQEMITSITIGPNCKLTSKDIKEMLIINGYNTDKIDIKKSAGSLR